MILSRVLFFVTQACVVSVSLAEAPLAWPLPVRRLPPMGLTVPAADLGPLLARLGELQRETAKLKHAYLPDVEVYLDAVDYALNGQEIYDLKELKIAAKHLETAAQRLAELKASTRPPSWTRQPGLSVRGFRSAIDGSAQPYGVEIPAGYDFTKKDGPLYVWLHGRGDKNTNLTYLANCEKKKGQFPPSGQTMAIHPFGRHCVGYKAAGETDVLEAVAATLREYPVSVNRVALMGFSMGGAGAWHLGAHHNDLWAIVHAGAGFVDVRRYTNLTPEKMPPTYEQRLWGVYDVPNYALNLLNRPLVAYSGAEDKQKAAADIMEETLASLGHKLHHVVGPKMGHKYNPEGLKEVQTKVDAALAIGREQLPAKVLLQTQTLRYSKQSWLEATGLQEHWMNATVRAELSTDLKGVKATTSGITGLRFHFPKEKEPQELTVDGTKMPFAAEIQRSASGWQPAPAAAASGLRKRPGLQGPMDDALWEAFLLVEPSGPAASLEVQKWTAYEVARFKKFWQELFRGRVRVKKDKEVTAEDLQSYHVLVFGDPTSNSLLARMVASGKPLPARWAGGQVTVGGKSAPAATSVPAFIYPNPLNPTKYVVVNNGCSFREGHCTTNALQNPKLPDWALFDLKVPPSDFLAGGLLGAGFFTETWK